MQVSVIWTKNKINKNECALGSFWSICRYLPPSVPPTIEDALKEVIAVGLGESIIIHCRASGFPPPQISWQKDYQDIPRNSLAMRVLSDGSLVINSTRVGDTGQYACLANNVAGFQTRQVTLKVQGRRKLPRGSGAGCRGGEGLKEAYPFWNATMSNKNYYWQLFPMCCISLEFLACCMFPSIVSRGISIPTASSSESIYFVFFFCRSHVIVKPDLSRCLKLILCHKYICNCIVHVSRHIMLFLLSL